MDMNLTVGHQKGQKCKSTQDISGRQKKHNETIFILRHISQTTSLHLTSGAFATAFMLFIGLNTEKISVVNFATNLGLVIASIFVVFAYNWDKSGLGIIRWCSILNGLIPAGMLIAGFVYMRSLNVAFIILVIFSLVGNTAYSMRNSAEINAVPMLFGRSRYVLVLGRCGYLGGMATLGISIVTLFLLSSTKDIGYYRVFFLISLVLFVMNWALSLFFRRPADMEKTQSLHVDFRLLLKKKYLLASIPHLLRGLGGAAIALWPATIMSKLSMTPLLSSMLIVIAIVAEIIGSCFYVRISWKLKPGFMTMIGFCASSVFLFMTPWIRTIAIFFVCYFFYNLMNSAFGKALMAMFVYSCDEEELALVSSFHVLYYALSYCPAVVLFGKIMDTKTFPCMVVAGIIYIISGILMHVNYRKPVTSKNGDNAKGVTI